MTGTPGAAVVSRGMSEFVIVMSLALLPGFGNFLGGLLAESAEVTPKRLNQPFTPPPAS